MSIGSMKGDLGTDTFSTIGLVRPSGILGEGACEVSEVDLDKALPSSHNHERRKDHQSHQENLERNK